MVIGKKFATANFLNFSIKSPFLFYEFKINGLYLQRVRFSELLTLYIKLFLQSELQRVRFSELFTAADTFKYNSEPLRVRESALFTSIDNFNY